MSSGADLFVVCKQCGSQVSPYITECPYCGHRLRRRAPKLPREGDRKRTRRARVPSSLTRLKSGEIPGIRGEARPYVTIAIVLATCGVWIAWDGGFVSLDKLVILGPLHGDWWRLVSSQFTYASGFYQFTTLVAIALFGWLLERRHGWLVVFALFFACGVGSALVGIAVYPFPFFSGANGAALGLIAAWAVPDLRAARARRYYDGDLLGTAAIAGAVLCMPLARPEANWIVGVSGGLIGLLIGLGLDRAPSSH